MKLEGSCHCGAVRFTVEAPHPYPFNLCYCSICRKTAGGGGFAINLGALSRYAGGDRRRAHPELQTPAWTTARPARASASSAAPAARRSGSGTRAGPSSCTRTPRRSTRALPVPPERTHLLLADRAPWVEPCVGPHDKTFDGYPDEGIAEWHERLGLLR